MTLELCGFGRLPKLLTRSEYLACSALKKSLSIWDRGNSEDVVMIPIVVKQQDFRISNHILLIIVKRYPGINAPTGELWNGLVYVASLFDGRMTLQDCKRYASMS